jgi:hypothetical protein
VANGADSDWTLTRWADAIARWRAIEEPDDLVRQRVSQWLRTRLEDPYRLARREPKIPNLWYAVVPESERNGAVVVCTYWIEERTKTVRGDTIATLSKPVV